MTKKQEAGKSSISENSGGSIAASSSEDRGISERRGDHQSLDINKAYHVAGVVVAACQSRFHHLVGSIDLSMDGSIQQNLRTNPGKFPQQDDGQTLIGLAEPVMAERQMILMAGRQSELVHYTLHAPAETDKILGELQRTVPVDRNGGHHADQQAITDALAMVTHHWHDIECLAAWLSRKHERVLPAVELASQFSQIRPDDRGLFP